MHKTIAGFILIGAAATFLAPLTTARLQEAPPASVEAQQESDETATPCQGIDPTRMAGVLRGVPRYGATYVLVVPQRLASTITAANSPGVKDLHVGVQGASAAGDAARAAGIANTTEYAYDASTPFQLVQDVADGKVDAAVMWAPLAGLAIIQLGLDGAVSAYSIDRPHEIPPAFAAAAASDACSSAVADELDVSGVLPAELLVPVEIRPMLAMRAPAFDLAEARQGEAPFNEVCARCHGADAVADPHGLAPVDLRMSIRRFSYPGYRYIVQNGRPQKSMPPLRGTVTDEQIRLIYQYLKARSNHILTSANDHVAPAQAQPSEKGTQE
jgi:mono/diheme cytochrome c family protein